MINYSIVMRSVNANLFEINQAKARIKAAKDAKAPKVQKVNPQPSKPAPVKQKDTPKVTKKPAAPAESTENSKKFR